MAKGRTMERNNIYLGDCLDLMDGLSDKSVDMILSDLPYGTTQCKWDIVIPFNRLWKQYERVIKDNGAIVLTAAQPFATDLISSNRRLFRYDIIWEKTLPLGFLNAKRMPLRTHEHVLVFYKKLPTYNPIKTKAKPENIGWAKKRKNSGAYEGYQEFRKEDYEYEETGLRLPRSVIQISNWNGGSLHAHQSKKPIHPTQKPVPLFRYFIETYTNPSELVLDTCAGSGTTGVACIESGRDFIIMEKDETHYQRAKNRIEHAKLQKDLSLGL